MVYLYQHDANTNISTYVASTQAEISTLPTRTNHGTFLNAKVHQYAHMGDVCLILADASVYMYDGQDDTWKLLASNGSDGEGSGEVSSANIFSYQSRNDFPIYGTDNCLYYAIDETSGYVWTDNQYSPISPQVDFATVDETLAYLGL